MTRTTRWGLAICMLLWPALGNGQPDAPEHSPSGRPKIGLVLGGGGALGLAHVGVLRALEEMRIPVDCIAGTSMGAIVAGLYASGMSPDEIEEALTTLDWWDIMKDQTPYRDLDFRRKEESGRYLMDLELGLQGLRILFPHGLAAGQKFNNFMQTLTLNAAGIADFDHLNIPYRAVATDLRNGRPVVLSRGNLGTAMRASMAVPGVFTPVEMDGDVLVDGGLVNNLPVDQAEAMGADAVIAVDVGATTARAQQQGDFHSLGEILGRTYTIMQRTKDEGRRQAADILIEPELVGFSPGDFHRAAELIPRGTEAAEAQSSALARLSVSVEDYEAWRRAHRAHPKPDMTIRSVEIVGNRRVPKALILKRVETQAGDALNFNRIQKDVARIHGMGDFSTVTKHLIPTGQPGEYDLKIDTQEKYWGPGYIHFGLRLESDFDGASSWGMLFNLRRAGLNDLGGEARVDIEAGRQQKAFLELYQPLQSRGFLFVAPSIELSKERTDIYQDDERVAEYARAVTAGRFDLGTQYKEYGEFRAGILYGELDSQPEVGAVDLPGGDPALGAWTMRLTVDRRDARVFFRKGVYLGLNGYFSTPDLGADDRYRKLEGRAMWAQSRGAHTGVLGIRAGHALGSDVPFYDQFSIGGMNSLPGLAYGALRGPHYGIVSVNYYYRAGYLTPSLGRGIYLLAGVNAGNVWMERGDIDPTDVVVGGMGGVALDTVLGPIAVVYGRAEKGNQQLYFTVGTLF